jgi:site-specific recombinase XerC
MLSDLNALYRQHLFRRARRGGEVGSKTRRERRIVLERALRDLHSAGFELQRLKNLQAKHIRHVIEHWQARGLQSSSLASYCSHLRVLCRWLGKPQLILVLDGYVAARPRLTRRRTATDRDRSERAVGVDFPTLLNRALSLDQRFAAQLALIAAFGLRSQEAWLFRPHLAEHGRQVRVLWGTKGGRPRLLPLPLTPEQKAVLEWAKQFAATPAESMIPPGWSVQRWRWRYYRLCKKIGLTRRALAVTPHSLRHGVLLDLYEALTGSPAPARGGELAQTDPQADAAARQVVAENAGHSRPQVSSAYLGPVRPRAPAVSTRPSSKSDELPELTEVTEVADSVPASDAAPLQ